MSTLAATSPSSPPGDWLSPPKLRRTLARVHRFLEARPQVYSFLRVLSSALGTWALMPTLLAYAAIVSPMFLLLFWVVVLARILGRSAALSASVVGVWASATSAVPLAVTPKTPTGWAFAAFYLALAGTTACIVSASVQALRDQRQLHRQEQRAAVRQSALVQALGDALRVRESFLGVAGHELRSPVTGALLHAQRWQRRSETGGVDGEAQGAAWQRQVRQLGRLARLMEGLLDASHLAHGAMALHPESLDICTVVREVVDRLSEAACRADCPIGLRLPKGGFYGRFDRLRLEQVVENLVCNALKYGAGKPIDVEVRKAQGSMMLSVTDRGIGIAKMHQERIFDAYERIAPSIADECQPAGLGLGLWLVKQIVTAAEGEATVSSQPGRGATFVVRLPC